MRRLRSGILTVLTVLLLAAGGARTGWWLWRRHRTLSAGRPLAVQIQRVKRGELTEIVNAPGEITPKRKVSISARVAARITELPFDEGQTVTCGNPNATPPVSPSVLVRLDDRDLRSNLRSAIASCAAQKAQIEVEKARIAGQQASLQAAGAQLEQAESDLERKRGLLATHDVSQAVFDEIRCKVDAQRAEQAALKHALEAAQLNLVVLQHRLEVAEAQIEQAQEALTYTTITSPIDGVVTRVNAEVGELVVTGTMNNPGTVIMEVADLSTMLVLAQVDEADVAKVAVRQPTNVRIQAFGERVFKGKVDSIALTNARSQTGTKYYKTEILLATAGLQIPSGLTVDVEIETARHANVLIVPSQAVLGRKVDELPCAIRENSAAVNRSKTYATVVFRCVDGKAAVTPVTIGPANVTHTAITAGIDEHDRIIIGPYKILDKLNHDAAVEDERNAKPAEPKGNPAKRKE